MLKQSVTVADKDDDVESVWNVHWSSLCFLGHLMISDRTNWAHGCMRKHIVVPIYLILCVSNKGKVYIDTV